MRFSLKELHLCVCLCKIVIHNPTLSRNALSIVIDNLQSPSTSLPTRMKSNFLTLIFNGAKRWVWTHDFWTEWCLCKLFKRCVSGKYRSCEKSMCTAIQLKLRRVKWYNITAGNCLFLFHNTTEEVNTTSLISRLKNKRSYALGVHVLIKGGRAIHHLPLIPVSR